MASRLHTEGQPNEPVGHPDVRVMAIADIIIEDRVRQDMGDIEGLAQSIAEVGLLQPVAVTTANIILAGERRVRACQILGWTEIPAYVVTGYDDLADRLAAERDENLHRKQLARSEMVVMASRIEAALAQQAAARKAATQFKPGKHRLVRKSDATRSGITTPDRATSTNATEDPSKERRARDEVAKAVGTSATSLRKTREVMEAEQDPDPEVRAVATEARQEMDRTGKVDPAHRKVQDVRGGKRPATKAQPRSIRPRASTPSTPAPTDDADEADDLVPELPDADDDRTELADVAAPPPLRPPDAFNLQEEQQLLKIRDLWDYHIRPQINYIGDKVAPARYHPWLRDIHDEIGSLLGE